MDNLRGREVDWQLLWKNMDHITVVLVMSVMDNLCSGGAGRRVRDWLSAMWIGC